MVSYILGIPKEEKVLADNQLESFFSLLRKEFPKKKVPFLLSPLLYSQKQQLEDTPFVVDIEVGTSVELSKVGLSQKKSCYTLHAS